MKKILVISLLLFSAAALAVDSDGDGVDDSMDAFPNNPEATTDTDGDGLPDVININNQQSIFADSFESGNYTTGGWTLGGNMSGTPWTIYSFGGSNGYVAKLTQPSNCMFGCPSSIAYIQKTVTVPPDGGTINFSLKGAVGFDYGPAQFYIDGGLSQQWDGGLSNWTPVTKTLSAGTHVLKWQTTGMLAPGYVYIDAVRVVVTGQLVLVEDTDDDNDNSLDVSDNCPLAVNVSQTDVNNNGIGDKCDYSSDTDSDGINDSLDNCSLIPNSIQTDSDVNGRGDACEVEAGWIDNSFNPGTGANNGVRAITVQPDGKIIIGGNFSNYNGVVKSRIARLNSNGLLDSSFTASVNSYVYTLKQQPDGKIIVGGDFTSVNGVAQTSIARLNIDGSVDSGFNLNPTNGYATFYDVAVQSDGKILICGSFSTTPSRRIVERLNADGSVDYSFNNGTGPNTTVNALAVQADGKIIIGGVFTSYSGTSINRIARLNTNGSLDSSFNPGTGFAGINDYVQTIVVQANGKIIVGGYFSAYNGTARNAIVRLNVDGSLDANFNSAVGVGAINTIADQADGKIIIAGYFAAVNGAARNRIARLHADGSLDLSFNPSGGSNNNTIYASAIQPDGKIILGGAFTSYNGTAINRIARIHSGDSDADGIEDAADQFPNDTDNDGLTNEIDPDDDNDGMPDSWEILYGFNPLVNDANLDADNDGLTNGQEFTNGSNPTINSVKNDYNHDGIAGWIWKGISSGNETASQNWQLTFPLYSPNWGVPNRFYHPVFPDQLNWEIVTSGDFNKDGDTDILWRNTSTAEWKVWQMQNGLRAAQNSPPNFDLAHEWKVVGAGDTDKDGDDDVVLNNTTSGEVLVWQMQNNDVVNSHNFGSATPYLVNRIGDFDKDGDVDLLFRETGGDVLATWEIEANAFVLERALANTGTNYNPVCSGDFDSDGDDDIMLVNTATTQEKWFVMENFARTQVVGATNNGFVFKGCGDYDGDGDADILWQRSTDDANRVILQQNYGASKQTVYTNAFGAVNGFVYRGNSN